MDLKGRWLWRDAGKGHPRWGELYVKDPEAGSGSLGLLTGGEEQ